MKPFFDKEELENLARCLESGWVTQGPMVTKFEKLFSEVHGTNTTTPSPPAPRPCISPPWRIGLKPGDEALVPALTWVTSANCVEYAGAKAVFVDIAPATFNIDPAKIEAAITPRTKAIVVVHLFGLSAEMDKIMEIAARRGLKIIEDCACAVGCAYDGKPVGGIGDAGCFSFHPRKVVTTGEGGMVSTNDKALADMVNSLRNHGTIGGEPGPGAMPKPYDMSPVENLGYNLRLSDIQGAVGLAQMGKLKALLAERKAIAGKYFDALADVGDLALPFVPPKCGHSYQSFVVRILDGGRARRNAVMEALAADGIQSRPGTHAVHRLGYYRRKYDIAPDAYPNACDGEDLSITLPVFHGMTDEDLSRVVASFKKSMDRRS
jgi:dTDP-4-amino-4,6-dideoxygalactose transaminase